MKFYLRMALRELRRGRRKFLFFLLCIAIGVAGIVAVKGFNASLQGALLREARTLMAADMQVSMSHPASEEQLRLLHELQGRSIQVVTVTETASMAVDPVGGETTLVEVKAVEPGYPFYGVLEMNPVGELSAESILVGGELLDRLGLTVGSSLKIGSALFRIAGVITKEPDRVTAGFGVGPRVMMNQEGLARTGLIKLGSRARYSYLLKLANDTQVGVVRDELQAAFAKDRARVADFREAQPQIKRFLDRMTSFLSLVSMVALLVGGLGVANAARVFIQQKLDAIAVMKCLGATNRRATFIYLTQMLMLGVSGSALGVATGYLIQLVMPKIAGSLLDLKLDLTLSPIVALQGLTVGLVTSVLFTLLPLAAIADVKPALVFRREMAEGGPRSSRRQRLRTAALLGMLGIGMTLIAAWVSAQPLWSLYFTGGLVMAVLLLGLATQATMRIVRAIGLPRRWVAARQGLANLHRPGSQAGAVVLALGIGVTMVLTVYLLQRGLSREVQLTAPAGAPNIFFMGLQATDIPSFTQFLRTNPGIESAPDPVPLVRGRMLRINGKGREALNLSDDAERWFNFQFSLTYSATIPLGNEVVQGRWWTAQDYANRPLVSVEQEAATRLNLTLHSVIDMELEGGLPIQAEVFNIRKTKDFRAGGAFNFVFAPGALDQVPATYLAQGRVRPGAVGAVQKEAVAKFPALTIINLSDVLETVGSVLDRIGLVIRFVAGFSVAAGLIILASSIAATKFRRTREAVLYKTLGATRQRVWRIFAAEYATLGLVSGLVGTLFASVTAWIVLTRVMEIDFHFEVGPLLTAVGVTVALTVVVGVMSTYDVVATRPLQVLREE